MIKQYFSEKKSIIVGVVVAIIYNLYFGILLPDLQLHNLWYLDFLVAFLLIIFFVSDYSKFKKTKEEEQENSPELKIEELEERLKVQFNANCDLEDYITRWCHEVKIPLAAALLVAQRTGVFSYQLENEENNNTVDEEDTQEVCVPSDRQLIREQLEKINQLLNNALLGCKVQSSLFDINIHKVKLMDCIKESIHNNQFFLIQKHFELDINVEDEDIYTDKAWLVYILDQLLTNSIKYRSETPKIKIWTLKDNNLISLCIEDNGEGIKEEDIRRIYEKGFTGSNSHNGQYKSTGMGLYMAKSIADRLGHDISVTSNYGEFTRFVITFSDNREYFMM